MLIRGSKEEEEEEEYHKNILGNKTLLSWLCYMHHCVCVPPPTEYSCSVVVVVYAKVVVIFIILTFWEEIRRMHAQHSTQQADGETFKKLCICSFVWAVVARGRPGWPRRRHSSGHAVGKANEELENMTTFGDVDILPG